MLIIGGLFALAILAILGAIWAFRDERQPASGARKVEESQISPAPEIALPDAHKPAMAPENSDQEKDHEPVDHDAPTLPSLKIDQPTSTDRNALAHQSSEVDNESHLNDPAPSFETNHLNLHTLLDHQRDLVTLDRTQFNQLQGEILRFHLLIHDAEESIHSIKTILESVEQEQLSEQPRHETGPILDAHH